MATLEFPFAIYLQQHHTTRNPKRREIYYHITNY